MIYEGDCLEIMPTLPDKSTDMILCDLPYGTTACKWDTVIPFNKFVIDDKKVVYEQEFVFNKMKQGLSFTEATALFNENCNPGLWDQYKRIIKDNGAIVLTASQPFTSALVMSNPGWFKYEWVWDKAVATDCMNVKNKPMKKHENVLVFSSGTTANCSDRRMLYKPQGLRPTKRQRSGIDYGPNEGTFKTPRPSHHAYIQELENYPTSVLYFNKENGAVHPTQKPAALFEYLIRTYTNEGDTVLDNCAGSGTTGVAAMNTGRKFVLIEKDAGYCEIIRKRIADHEPLLSI